MKVSRPEEDCFTSSMSQWFASAPDWEVVVRRVYERHTCFCYMYYWFPFHASPDSRVLEQALQNPKTSAGLNEWMDARLDVKLKQVNDTMDDRFAQTDAKMDARFEQMDAKMDGKFEQINVKLDSKCFHLGKYRPWIRKWCNDS